MMLDLYLFQLINGLAGQWTVLDILGIFFAIYSGYILMVILLVYLIIDFKKHRRMVFEALIASFFVRFFVVEIIWRTYFNPRPFVNYAVHLLVPYSSLRSSFPSAHAAFYFALSTIIYRYHKKMGIVFYMVSFVMAISRVFIGIHWPQDILVGGLLGISIGWILNKLFSISLFSYGKNANYQ